MAKLESKAAFIACHGGPSFYEASGLPLFKYNLLTDGGEVVCLTSRVRFTLQGRILALTSVSGSAYPGP
jgi:hypothetical protein